jgi:hypothetical protein
MASAATSDVTLVDARIDADGDDMTISSIG